MHACAYVCAHTLIHTREQKYCPGVPGPLLNENFPQLFRSAFTVLRNIFYSLISYISAISYVSHQISYISQLYLSVSVQSNLLPSVLLLDGNFALFSQLVC